MISLAWILNKIIQWQWEKWKLKISCQSSGLHKVRRGERLKLQLPQGKQHNLLALLLWKTFLLLYGVAKGDPKEKITTKSHWKTVTHNCTQNPRAVLLESKVCRTNKKSWQIHLRNWISQILSKSEIWLKLTYKDGWQTDYWQSNRVTKVLPIIKSGKIWKKKKTEQKAIQAIGYGREETTELECFKTA